MQATAKLLAAALVLAASGAAQADDRAVVSTEKLGWRMAEQLASDAVAACAAHGWSVVATVVDPTGRQQAMIKGDTAAPHSIALSFRKAYTAFFYGKLFDKNTIAELVKTPPLDDAAVRAALNTMPEVAFVRGGVAIRKVNGSVLGGIGVSGAPGGDKDEACGMEAIAKHKDAWK